MTITTMSQEEKFLKLFKGGLRIQAHTMSIKTLLSERNLQRIDYSPYYQRNYVWDVIKQTFFIESVILGTEIPPLILFKSGMSKIEVIDGRQRFETLKRFKQNELKLNSKGLMALQALGGKSFNTLNPIIQNTFWDSHIRVFEFEIINEPSLEDSVEDKVKKEIFRRYNTGITPLTTIEVDNAKYEDEPMSNKFKEELEIDIEFYQSVKNCFFYNEDENNDLLSKMVNYLRKCYIINKFPIVKYAQGAQRSEIIDLLYDSSVGSIDESELENDLLVYKKQINEIAQIQDYFIRKERDDKFKNRLIYECLLWAIRVLEQENVHIDLIKLTPELKEHFDGNIEIYSQEDSHYDKNIIGRFNDIASFFKDVIHFDFGLYFRNSDFTKDIKKLRQNEDDLHGEIKQLESLRINKPSPISIYVDDLKMEVKSSRYLIRPPYQRQERITVLKASSIIESILLNIKLPPIFIYKRNDSDKHNDSVKEVVDGQQRLLSIIGFLGEQYTDEKNKLTFSKNNSFKLKGLKILTELNGKNYQDLLQDQKDKILDFIIDEIIIEERINERFEPTDLFIRLNQKPYPIKQNSFEMWNSTVDKDIIQKIKIVTNKHFLWFFSREINVQERTDRMDNEELVTVLSYIVYNNKSHEYDKTLGLFLRQNRITCRIKDKNSLTIFLNRLEKNVSEKNIFLECIDETDRIIRFLGQLLKKTSKETLNTFLNVKKSRKFIRSFQDFYIIWLILGKVPLDIATDEYDNILGDITSSLRMLKNADGKIIDEQYMMDFKNKISGEKYKKWSNEKN